MVVLQMPLSCAVLSTNCCRRAFILAPSQTWWGHNSTWPSLSQYTGATVVQLLAHCSGAGALPKSPAVSQQKCCHARWHNKVKREVAGPIASEMPLEAAGSKSQQERFLADLLASFFQQHHT